MIFIGQYILFLIWKILENYDGLVQLSYPIIPTLWSSLPSVELLNLCSELGMILPLLIFSIDFFLQNGTWVCVQHEIFFSVNHIISKVTLFLTVEGIHSYKAIFFHRDKTLIHNILVHDVLARDFYSEIFTLEIITRELLDTLRDGRNTIRTKTLFFVVILANSQISLMIPSWPPEFLYY